jgi:hypothetical protein
MLPRETVSDGNDYAAVSNAIEPLSRVAKKTGAHLMLLHHQGKGAVREEIDAMGSEAYRAAADVLIEASKSKGEHFIRATIRGADDLPKTRVTVDLETGEVEAVEAEVAEFRAAKKAICAFIDGQEEGVTEDDIEKAVGLKRGTVSKALREGVKDGLFTRSGAGKRGSPYLYKSCSRPSHEGAIRPRLHRESTSFGCRAQPFLIFKRRATFRPLRSSAR